MKLEGRAEMLAELVDAISKLAQPTGQWIELKNWLDDELRDIRLECLVLGDEIGNQ